MNECDVCKINLFPNDVESHIRGKKHLKNLQKLGTLSSGDEGKSVKGTQGDLINKPEAPRTVTPQNGSKRNKRKKENKLKLESKIKVPDVNIDKLQPFPKQVDDMIRQIQQNDLKNEKIRWVLSDVATTFRYVIPDVMPVLYGSQLTGLAFRTSDIDVYLDNPCGGNEDRDFVKKYGKIIYRNRLFTNIVQVRAARVPVIKAKHISTGIELDISASSSQAVANSVLLQFLLSHDPRIRKLMMIIGFWAKKCQLISTNRFSRYSINLLIIFYLQCLQKPLLPPLYKLVIGIPGKTWPFRVRNDPSLLENNNDTPLHSLFMGFYEFYQNFVFKNLVISTYLGYEIPASDLDNPEVLDRMIYYKTYLLNRGEPLVLRDICIQDPLELSHNTSKAVNDKMIEQFHLACKKIVDMKKNLKPEDWLHEIINGQVAIPIVVKKSTARDICFDLFYKTSENWIDDFANDFHNVMKMLKIQLETNDTVPENCKKAKLDASCLMFSLETDFNPFTKGFVKNAIMLHNGEININIFLNVIDTREKEEANRNFKFIGTCLVREIQKNILNLRIHNTGDSLSFYQLGFQLRRYLQLFINHMNPLAVVPGSSINIDVHKKS